MEKNSPHETFFFAVFYAKHLIFEESGFCKMACDLLLDT